MAFFYLFYGEQTYAIEQAIQKKIREITATQSIDLHNFSVADCLSDNSFFITLQDVFFTPPFSGNTQIFYIKELEALLKPNNLPIPFKNLTPEKITQAQNNSTINFIHFLTKVLIKNTDTENTIAKDSTLEKNNFILLQANLKDLSAFPPFFQKILKQQVSSHYYKAVTKNEELVLWIRKQLTQKKMELTGEQVQLLLYFCGEDIYTLAQEIEKLSLLKRKIENDDITSLVSQSKTYQIFSLLQDIIAKNQMKKLEDLKHFLTQGTNNAQKIFNLLANELQKLLKVRWLLNEGYKIEKIANFLKLPSWLATKLVKSAANLQPQEIENSLLFLHSNDIAFKYAAKNVEPLIMQFCIQWMNGYFLKRYK